MLCTAIYRPTKVYQEWVHCFQNYLQVTGMAKFVLDSVMLNEYFFYFLESVVFRLVASFREHLAHFIRPNG